jgi:tetratricopeptide (TPR) repeat protein
MKHASLRNSVYLLAIALCFGCNDTTKTLTDSSDHQQATVMTSADESPGVADPVRRAGNPYRAMLTREALKGLNYQTGRVTIDADGPALVVGLEKSDATELHDLAKTAYQQGRLLDSLKYLSQSINLDSKNAQAYETLGTTLLGKKKTDKAEAAFRTAIDLDPQFAKAHEQLGLTLSGSPDRFDEAINHYEIASDLDPENGHIHSRLAILNYYLGQTEKSRKHIDLATVNGYLVPPQLRDLLDRKLGPGRSNGGSPNIGNQVRVDFANDSPGNETTAVSSDCATASG